MPIEITIPRLGWSMEEANFLSWLKKEGESVKSGDPLFSMESEKATQDIEAVDGGILRISPNGPKAGDIVKVGQVIGYLHGKDEHLENATIGSNASPVSEVDPSDAKFEEEANIITQNPPEQTKDLSQIKKTPSISPRARRRAAELGVDVTNLNGSGATGRIIEADVVKNRSVA
jgi:pyruvate dehydrogenase E2 component (dihydrolipoamide acetyltransferase)